VGSGDDSGGLGGGFIIVGAIIIAVAFAVWGFMVLRR
jgi:hypothetical protein